MGHQFAIVTRFSDLPIPVVLVGGIFLVTFVALLLGNRLQRRQRIEWNSAEQLRRVSTAEFRKQPLLNKSEARVFAAAERAIAQAGLNWRVMAQVNLGEILTSKDDSAFRAINSKRVDLLVVTSVGEPVAAIEYQGSGHYQGNAQIRDAIKRAALTQAGIAYIEISRGDRTVDLYWQIARLAEEMKGSIPTAFGTKQPLSA